MDEAEQVEGSSILDGDRDGDRYDAEGILGSVDEVFRSTAAGMSIVPST